MQQRIGNFGDTTDIGGDKRSAAGDCFQQHVRYAFRQTGQHDQVSRAIPVSQTGLRLTALEVHFVCEIQLLDLLLQLGMQRSVTE